jgi:hydroxymethylglutaryl-CoA reductase
MNKTINGFSKLSKQGKIDWLSTHFLENTDLSSGTHEGGSAEIFSQFQATDVEFQRVFDGFSENTVANFPIPYGIAPNFVINDKTYAVPMVIEESSVVAAAASAAKFWSERGGFKAEVLGTTKVGQVHFTWSGKGEILRGGIFDELKTFLIEKAQPITANMERRGGGIRAIELVDFTDEEPDYYQLRVQFETCDSMGANFINSVLESFGEDLTFFLSEKTDITPVIVMCILSNYTPECVVRASVECAIEAFHHEEAVFYAEKFRRAVRIAKLDPYRAVTHNKGIMNGIDAVVLATANDFRAIEACAHAFASRDGQYRSLSDCAIEDGRFKFWIDMPLAVGTVGGLTSLHPLAKLSLEILGNPSAAELMQIIAVVGLAQNFGAVRSLVTTGIQRGHMKMHLTNILNHLHATKEEATAAVGFFDHKMVSFTAVREFLADFRK